MLSRTAKNLLVAAMLLLVTWTGQCADRMPKRVNGVWDGLAFRVQSRLPSTMPTGLAGFTDCATLTIFITAGQAEWWEADTLLHELQHAMACSKGDAHNEYYNNEPGMAHWGIYWATPRWHWLLVQNPGLVKWIMGIRPPADVKSPPETLAPQFRLPWNDHR